MDIYKGIRRSLRRHDKRPSGLDILSRFSKDPQEFSSESAERFAESARVQTFTWPVYAGAEALRAWEFLALFHHLDPRALALDRDGRLAYIERMANAASSQGKDLLMFVHDLARLREALVAQMPERVRPQCDAVQMIIPLTWFDRWAEEDCLVMHPEAKRNANTVTLIDPTPLMRDFARGAEQVRVILEQGGPVNPPPGKLPWVHAVFRAVGLSQNLAEAAATIVARPHQGGGRPAKR